MLKFLPSQVFKYYTRVQYCEQFLGRYAAEITEFYGNFQHLALRIQKGSEK